MQHDAAMKLVIFDLDHTLVNLFSVHDKAYHKTMEEIFGIKACYKRLDYTGKRIPDLIREYALKAGVTMPVIRMNLEEAERVYELNFAMNLRNARKHVLPGAVKLLAALQKKHKLALVTGDLRSIAALVLKETGLDAFFPIIATAEDALTRAGIVKRAIKKAGKVSEVWVIGDSTRDIEAGKANGAKTIAVMTGEHDEKTLRAAKPAYIFKGLTPTTRILEAIG
jgi:HAD superfamily hydrolase (TIGR01549 family)